jgi:hypothetical protein
MEVYQNRIVQWKLMTIARFENDTCSDTQNKDLLQSLVLIVYKFDYIFFLVAAIESPFINDELRIISKPFKNDFLIVCFT